MAVSRLPVSRLARPRLAVSGLAPPGPARRTRLAVPGLAGPGLASPGWSSPGAGACGGLPGPYPPPGGNHGWGRWACPSPGASDDGLSVMVLLRGTRPQNCSPIAGLPPVPLAPILARSSGVMKSSQRNSAGRPVAPGPAGRPVDPPRPGADSIMSVPTLQWLDPPRGPAVALLDQTRLPAEEKFVTCENVPRTGGRDPPPGDPRCAGARRGRRVRRGSGRLPGRRRGRPRPGCSARPGRPR